MDINNPVLVLVLAFFIDVMFGDPQYRYHPVRMIGLGISFILYILNKIKLNGYFRGILLTLIMVGLSIMVYTMIYLILSGIHSLSAFFYNIFICYSFIAFKNLVDHAMSVRKAIESGDLYEARKAVSMIVGRDTKYLDEKGVIRATIETIAENFVDGFLSPVFWYAAGCVFAFFTGKDPVFYGLCFMIIFKVASTLDSMVGHRDKEFLKIGWMGARLDDVMNFIPARLSLFILFMGSWFGSFHSLDGLRVAFRDRYKHNSPNSAHPESFFAGVLNTHLGGPIQYSHGIKNYLWLGEEYGDPDLRHMKMGIRLVKVSSWTGTFIACTVLFSL